MTVKETISRILLHSQMEIFHLPKRYVIALAPAMASVHQELQKGLQWLEQQNKTSTFTAQSKRNVLVQLDAAFEAMKDTVPHMSRTLRNGRISGAEMANKHIAEDYEKFSKIFGSEIKPVAFEVAGNIALGATKTAKKFAHAMEKDIRFQLTKGVLAQESFAQISKRISGYAPAGLKIGQRYNWWAERIVRTEVMDAYNVQADNNIRELHEHDNEVVRLWNSAIDRRTCIICADLDGKTAAPGKDFPGGYDAPPAHPACRCICSSFRKDWEL